MEVETLNIETQELLNRLETEDDIALFFKENEGEFLTINLRELLNELVAHKELKLSDIVRKSGQGDYVYKVFNGDRKPSRDILIGIAIGMNLTFKETQFVLRIAKQAALDPRDKRDSILIYSINTGLEYPKVNDLLSEMNEKSI